MQPSSSDPWNFEADAIELLEGDFDVADAAELPAELSHHAIAASLDWTFEETFEEWFNYLWDPGRQEVLLALEQSCDEGILLPWEMRAVRLWTAPPEAIAALHWCWDRCPKHVSVALAHYVYWLVRAERSRRKGSPCWTPAEPVRHVETSFGTFSKRRPPPRMFSAGV